MRSEWMGRRPQPRLSLRWLAVYVTVLCLLVTVSPVAAHVVVHPARIEATVEDGTQLPPIEVTNRGERPVRVLAYTGFGGHDLRGAPRFRDDPAARQASGQILRLDKDQLYVPPGGTARVGATVHLPPGFSGGLYPVVFLEVQPVDAAASGGVQAVGRVAVLTLLSAGGTPAVQAEEAVVRPGSAVGTVEVAVRVRNEGDLHALAAGTVAISDAAGVPLAELPLTPATILPGHARELAIQWLPPATAIGPYVATVHMDEPGDPSPLQVVFILEPVPAVADAGGAGR